LKSIKVAKFEWVEIGLTVGGLFVVSQGERVSSPALTSLGALLVGIGLLVGGIGTAVTRRRSFWGEVIDDAPYLERAAVSLGLALTMIGATVIAFALARLLGLYDAFLVHLRQHPGGLMFIVGVVLLSLASAMFIGAWALRGSWKRVLASLSYWFIGLLLSLVGAVTLVMGLFEMLLPDRFDALLASILKAILKL
jgi:uncharacterized membrane protein YidH (DUF202 family)